jgi:diguanylate cyclase
MEDEYDRLLDALAQILRIYGSEGPELEGLPGDTTRALCERWVEHLTLLRPSPRGGDLQPTIGVAAARDLPGLRDFFQGHRRSERRLVQGALGDLKGVVGTFLKALERALPQDAADDAQASAHLARLRDALTSPSIDQLKHEVGRAVATLNDIIARRQLRARAHAEALQRVIESLGTRLKAANREGGLDPLTRLHNRRALEEHMQRTVEMRNLAEAPASLLLVDADHFKGVNDAHGHPVGDAALVALANSLVRTFPRKSDCVARFGGEEFAIVLRDCPMEDAQRLAERARAAASRLEIDAGGGEIVKLTVSIGVAELGRDELARAWLERADRALYQAKHDGRDRVVAASPAA